MKILISGYYGFGNVGDEAVLAAIVRGLKAGEPESEITVLSVAPGLTAELDGVRAIPRYAPVKILRAMAGTDLFISGGGSLFQDATSTASFWYYIGLVILAKLLRKKVMIFAQGFGPLRRWFNRRLAELVLPLADLITVRDEDSFRVLRRLGVKLGRLSLTADPAALLDLPPAGEGRKILSLEGIPFDRPLLGIALRSFKMPERDKEVLLGKLAKAIDTLVERYDFRPVFVLFQCPEDMAATAGVMELMQAESKVIFRTCRPDEMFSLFQHFSFVIGLRLHALVFAALAAVPAIALSYDPKVAAFAAQVGFPCVDLGLKPSEIDLESALENAFMRRAMIKETLRPGVKQMRDRAAKNFSLLFGEGRP
ncbi:MAG TPA: polysaccharide pyruvyl transferase CsaB [Candidatus Sulfotelmatobacter sp.]|nr:polysaccharide pyruvyl transferase CsaB [Candidatus Sulfotelmatobacter sp.]